MTTLFTEACFEVAGVQSIVDEVCEHLRSHGVVVAGADQHKVLTFDDGRGEIAINADRATMKVEAQTLTGIEIVREELTSQLIEYHPQLADRIIWSGDGCEQRYPAWFCLLTVADTFRVTPHVQRVRFHGSDLGRYSGFADIHMRLMFPRPEDRNPQWPHVKPNGTISYAPRDVLAIREYTYRHVDVAAGTLDIDFVLHEEAGPGSAFAARAKPGDVIGMSGPGGYSAPLDRDWYILAGDETAIPAIAGILETLPAAARGIAFIEVADATEEQSLDTKTGITIRWLHRNGAAPGTTKLLPDAVRAVEFPSDGSSVFAWAGCEFSAFKEIRSYMRKERGLKKGESLIVSYWRRGKSEDEVRGTPDDG
ncbi:siderophore-interacting protein [Paracoccus xiamenensis]|uniref:siderophore-interacting protein n=1 Tax=Paracoccus xiamenensis TaxID=2714901 RepID=UPI00140A9812|nr:siderophore-interacting protein [Paracoccus xiamenensis]NHF74009.1 siderophore-interacting protein [Paracoccus xiamenensis]